MEEFCIPFSLFFLLKANKWDIFYQEVKTK